MSQLGIGLNYFRTMMNNQFTKERLALTVKTKSRLYHFSLLDQCVVISNSVIPPYIDRSSIVRIEIPEGVKKIDSRAFEGCNGCVSIPSTVEKINTDAFCGSSKKIDGVHVSVIKVNRFELSSDNPFFSQVDELLLSKDQTELVACPGNLKAVVVPSTVRVIRRCSFHGCFDLKRVEIPSSVREIHSMAFALCRSLHRIDIPASVERVGHDAFRGCVNLEEVSLPESIQHIESGTFSDCSNLTHVTIPNTVKLIGGYAFGHCSKLTSVEMADDCLCHWAFSYSPYGVKLEKSMRLMDFYVEDFMTKLRKERWCSQYRVSNYGKECVEISLYKRDQVEYQMVVMVDELNKVKDALVERARVVRTLYNPFGL